MLFRALVTAALFLTALAPAGATEIKSGPKAVLELFTSQGCSSCPAADALLEQLAKRDDVVALAYHVDYWDYIGWPDTFGAKAYSDRQRDYAQSWGSSRIFTPQLVVNGRGGVVASRKNEVDQALSSAALPVAVELSADGSMLEITAAPGSGTDQAVIWLVTFRDRAEVDIQRGENKGKTIAYTQIVTGRQAVGMWEPRSGAEIRLPLDEVLSGEANGAAVLIQQEHDGLPGPIIGASSFIR